ncbi:MAG TPA: FAD synthetase family protein [Bacteroidales bacterium]|nr:FAD synthetase family protein [Bacteroidales bacterium]
MNVFYSIAATEGKIPNAVVTTGSFDGVHVGHKAIINRLNYLAAQSGGQSVLITFHPHPRKVLYPDQTDLKLIHSQEEKIQLLGKTGLQNLIILPFSAEFSKTSSYDFVSKILVEKLQVKVVVVGMNHHFGHNRQGDFTYLYNLGSTLGFRVEEISLRDIENEIVSSTKIRKALAEGNIQRANAYLDHQYIIRGYLHQNFKQELLPQISFLSIEIEEEEKLIPPPAFYATSLVCEKMVNKSVTLVATSDGKEKPEVLTHIISGEHNLFSNKGTILFYKKLMDLTCPLDSVIDLRQFEQAKEMAEELLY